MPSLDLADELADIKAEITRLQAREAQLRARLIDAPPEARAGRWNRGERLETRTPVFDDRRLPPSNCQDPQHWRDQTVPTLRCGPVQSRPGWPILRDPGPRTGAGCKPDQPVDNDG